MKPEEQKEIEERQRLVWQELEAKGFTMMERMKIRKVFMDFGRLHDDNIELNHKYNTYISKLLTGYGFSTEAEVKFLHALLELSPDANKEKLLIIASIIFKLLDIQTEWTFTKSK